MRVPSWIFWAVTIVCLTIIVFFVSGFLTETKLALGAEDQGHPWGDLLNSIESEIPSVSGVVNWLERAYPQIDKPISLQPQGDGCHLIWVPCGQGSYCVYCVKGYLPGQVRCSECDGSHNAQ